VKDYNGEEDYLGKKEAQTKYNIGSSKAFNTYLKEEENLRAILNFFFRILPVFFFSLWNYKIYKMGKPPLGTIACCHKGSSLLRKRRSGETLLRRSFLLLFL
jgi:hypothetical protein